MYAGAVLLWIRTARVIRLKANGGRDRGPVEGRYGRYGRLDMRESPTTQ